MGKLQQGSDEGDFVLINMVSLKCRMLHTEAENLEFSTLSHVVHLFSPYLPNDVH